MQLARLGSACILAVVFLRLVALDHGRRPDQRAPELVETMREMTPPNWGRSITTCMEDVSRYLTGWMSHYRLCTSDAIKGLGAIDAHIRRRIRAIIVRQRKRPRRQVTVVFADMPSSPSRSEIAVNPTTPTR
jgi:hypothetical protein